MQSQLKKESRDSCLKTSWRGKECMEISYSSDTSMAMRRVIAE